MAPLPQLPTDNLYKFLALTGLVLVVTSGYLNFEALTKWEKVEFAFGRSADRALSRVKQASSVVDSFQNTRKADSALNALQSVFDSEKAVDDSIIKLHTTERAEWKALLETHFLDWMWYSGWVLPVSGFSLWYWKVQRFQDRQLAAQTVTDERKNRKGAIGGMHSQL